MHINIIAYHCIACVCAYAKIFAIKFALQCDCYQVFSCFWVLYRTIKLYIKHHLFCNTSHCDICFKLFAIVFYKL